MEWMEQKTFDEERALYGRDGLLVRNCAFDGPADGESALKECRWRTACSTCATPAGTMWA